MTVDWVVLTAAPVGLGLAVMTVISGGLDATSSEINGVLQDDSVIQTAFAPPAFDYAGAVTDPARYQGRIDSMNAMQLTATPEEVAATVTDNIDQAVYWGMVEGTDRNNAAGMRAQIDYVLATEAFAVENGYDIGVTTANNPNGMTSAEFIAEYDRLFPG